MDSVSLKRTLLEALARREHSCYELRQRLLARGADAAELDAELEQLVEQGYQSDSRYAEQYVRSKVAKGYGPLYIRYGLRQRGVAPDLIDSVLVASEVDWVAVAMLAREKKFGVSATSPRMMRFLAGRGFSHDIIRQALADSASV